MGTPRSFDDYPPTMTTADVGELLGYLASTIAQLANTGRLPARKNAGS